MTELVERVDDDDRVIGLVGRDEAIRRRWLHRVATVVCRDTRGRILVHRRPHGVSRFPGGVNWMLGGAAEPGETYEEAAARELTEELGVRARPRLVLAFRCAGVISPYWLGLHETVVTGPVAPDPDEIAWHDWLTEPQLAELVRDTAFVPDAREAYDRWAALRRGEPSAAGPAE
ncbi:NTP pyrophosphohydrolase [Streptomyces sp. DH-12]|uniref:NUDIX hydrolase n=1 Tax=unclassified Streptomyces TaxID=2593676 RepID=UPI000CCEC0CC|nr:NUDIX domain-containing protein [Streptomyces sp. DH-12]PNV36198.1 NTP pyrophosphohydrolase [Streptomyces sp. DH-12]